jgi:hypothetical protein
MSAAVRTGKAHRPVVGQEAAPQDPRHLSVVALTAGASSGHITKLPGAPSAFHAQLGS